MILGSVHLVCQQYTDTPLKLEAALPALLARRCIARQMSPERAVAGARAKVGVQWFVRVPPGWDRDMNMDLGEVPGFDTFIDDRGGFPRVPRTARPDGVNPDEPSSRRGWRAPPGFTYVSERTQMPAAVSCTVPYRLGGRQRKALCHWALVIGKPLLVRGEEGWRGGERRNVASGSQAGGVLLRHVGERSKDRREEERGVTFGTWEGSICDTGCGTGCAR